MLMRKIYEFFWERFAYIQAQQEKKLGGLLNAGGAQNNSFSFENTETAGNRLREEHSNPVSQVSGILGSN